MPARKSNGSRSKKSPKKPIGQYEHEDEQRPNKPPVGLVTPEPGRDAGLMQQSLFDARPPRREAVELYEQAHGWRNRLVAGAPR